MDPEPNKVPPATRSYQFIKPLADADKLAVVPAHIVVFEPVGVPVRITTRGKRGSISLQYRSAEELEKLLKDLLGGA